jgi:Asp-tRNA(Asn)/Glu-tRNA(Gln) amidotransferase A subunit family amidase
MTGLRALGIAELAESYGSRQCDPAAVVDAYLAAIAAQDGSLRSFITVADATAREEAGASRWRWERNQPLGMLDGVPIAIKDNIDVAGLPCTAGVAAFRQRVPRQDAAIVTSLRQHGAVMLGKLNMHEGAFGATTDNPVYGRCINPVRPGYTPGGSSGGSGAAVAAGLCVAALGTDTMGSVRVPAAYCGVFGFKPTNDMVSTEGVVPLSHTLDTVGILTRSAADMAIMGMALMRSSSSASAASPTSLAGLRVGVPRQLAQIDMQPPIAAAFDRFISLLSAIGVVVVPVDLQFWDPGKARRAGLLVTEAEAAAYYIRHLGANLTGLSPGFAAMLRHPAQAGPGRIAAAYETIEAVRLGCLDAFGTVEIIASPTAPHTSFPHVTPAPPDQAECTALANFARAPAVSLPFATDPLPIGMQLMAAPGKDELLISVAVALEQALRK